jgi:lipopolysaccharide transport system permease protein
MMFYYGLIPSVFIFTLPLFLLLTLIPALGVSLWLAALNVQYRDVRYTIPFITQFWLFATPIAYPVSIIPEQWKLIYSLNPMVGVVEGFRWALIGKGSPPDVFILVSIFISVALLISGLFYFKRMERTFADVV